MTEKRGLYIVHEGTDGSGKSTQVTHTAKYLNDNNLETISVAEPGGTSIGDALRPIIKDGKLYRSPISNVELFGIARRELADQVTRPALESGINVVSDRNWRSTDIYQGFGEGLDRDLIHHKTYEVIGDLMFPDLIQIIWVPVDVVEERIRNRPKGSDYFEQKGREFFQKLVDGYLTLSEELGIDIIDGTQKENKVHQDVIEQIRTKLPGLLL
jgi:dTMP kinase